MFAYFANLEKNWTHKMVWNGKEIAKESRHRPVGIQPRMSRTQVEIVVCVFPCETKTDDLVLHGARLILLRA